LINKEIKKPLPALQAAKVFLMRLFDAGQYSRVKQSSHLLHTIEITVKALHLQPAQSLARVRADLTADQSPAALLFDDAYRVLFIGQGQYGGNDAVFQLHYIQTPGPRQCFRYQRILPILYHSYRSKHKNQAPFFIFILV
jgi:hypothetical protein